LIRVLISTLCLLILLASPTPVSAALPVNEGSLAPGGTSYEINPDGQGGLWVTDYNSGEIWQILPAETKFDYTSYLVGGSPSDARRGGDFLWWVDAGVNVVGRVAVLDGAYVTWRISGAETFYGTLDDQGRLWASEWPTSVSPPDRIPHIIRLTVAANGTDAELCTFTLPDYGGSSYLAYHNGSIWIADEENSRILRMNGTNYSYTSWDLPGGNVPFGLAVDPAGSLWFTHSTSISRLDPDALNLELKTYTDPLSASPQMVAVVGVDIWYTWNKGVNGGIGTLQSASASFTAEDLTSSSGTLTPQCAEIHAETTGDLTMVSGSIGWVPGSYPQITTSAGWHIFDMPEDEDGYADPWGIAAQDGKVYGIDQGRQKLVQIPLEEVQYSVFLPLIKR